MTRAYYSDSIPDFVGREPTYILGVLAQNHQFALEDAQKRAWMAQIEILKSALQTFRSGHIFFEYSIPRMGKRVDNILLLHGTIIVLEFKVGEAQYSSAAIDQVLDYALDLKNFHQMSHDAPILPVLVATNASGVRNTLVPYADKVFVPIMVNDKTLASELAEFAKLVAAPELDANDWCDSGYRPTPTIIQAAQALYRGHSVKEISRSDAGAINLSRTSDAISEIITQARVKQRKTICFITGVPGAGKTLAGLNIANERLQTAQDEHAVFLSGNGPLVMVLREALVRNEVEGVSQFNHERRTRKSVTSNVQAFIQNIHHFRDDALVSSRAPLEKIVVFDEAPRAWTKKQTADFMKRKRNQPNFEMSEPQFLISVMDRHPDWAVIVYLVGGGQEINTGEAGLLEWFDAIRSHFPNWHVCCSPSLADDEYMAGEMIADFFEPAHTTVDARLHLAVSVRSFRAESVSGLVKALLDNDLRSAQELYQQIGQKYPIALTRDIETARHWLKTKSRGTERYGILASSGAVRLRPIGIHVKANIDVVDWFLNSKDDVRSSYYLEDVATEFDIQGLEFDWSCVAWDADLRYSQGSWALKSFRGTKWQNIGEVEHARNLKNAYRVLLTRARQGMVILVPNGNDVDSTRKSEYYDQTFEFLKAIGFELL